MSLNGTYQSHFGSSTMAGFYGSFAVLASAAGLFEKQISTTLFFQAGLPKALELGFSALIFCSLLLARPSPPARAEAILASSTALRVLADLLWFLLLAGSWSALTYATSSLLPAAFLSGYLSVGLVSSFWLIWSRFWPSRAAEEN